MATVNRDYLYHHCHCRRPWPCSWRRIRSKLAQFHPGVACLYDVAMGDAYGNRLTQYEHSVDFPPRSMEDESEVSPCQLQQQRL